MEDYITENKYDREMASIELINHLKNKVNEFQLINTKKQNEIDSLILVLQDVVIERDRLKKEMKEYIGDKPHVDKVKNNFRFL